jgi:MFS family permease
MNEEQDFESDEAGSWSPAAVENGTAHKPMSSTDPHLRTPLSPPMTLPSGMSTPNLDSTRQGQPVATYPPPEPSWGNLPNKFQLAILAGSRFVDFFQMAALQTFMVHQLRSFDETLDHDQISHQAGVLLGSFTAAQIVTSILWGRAADQPMVGRKLVLQIGLIGTGFGCIGMAFSKTYAQAVFWRFMSGVINGTVGSARTMVAEITPKPWHPRAFLLLPAAFNVANVFGPILAGLLSDPIENMPHLFAEGSTFGGNTGVRWMKTYPFAMANGISTIFLWTEAILVHFFLQETLKGKRPLEWSKFNPVTLVRNAYSYFTNMKNKGYRVIREQRQGLLSNNERSSFEMDQMNSRGEKIEERPVQRLPFRRIWTSNVLWVLLTVAIFDFHMGAFNNLWILFLSFHRQFTGDNQPIGPPQGVPAVGAPAVDPGAKDAGGAAQLFVRDVVLEPRGLFKFAAGLNFSPATIGFAMAIIGFIGVVLQFLLYPWANARFGLMRAFRGSLFLFPAAYFLAPYIALLPSGTAPPEPASGWAIWMGISVVLFLQVAARTFALPATIILINNSSPHPSVLATIHGIGQATSATFRTLGPILTGYWFGLWTKRGIIGMAWWITGIISALGCVAAYWVRNGSGHEIFLPGEEPEMKDSETGGGSGDGR